LSGIDKGTIDSLGTFAPLGLDGAGAGAGP
jgi:hypothetical protein